MTAPPARDSLAGTPSNATAKAGLAALYDYTTERLGGGAGSANATEKAAARAALGVINADGLFNKASRSAAFARTGNGTANIKAGTSVNVVGTAVIIAADTAITMPTLVAGNDYAIYACTDGTVRADASFAAPSGYTAANSRQIGGFHFAPGGHSGSPGGGNSTPQIGIYSFWDLKWRPTCADPRGSVLVANSFWSDAYILNTDHPTNGSSKFAATIADGSSPPKVPLAFGGNGSTAYSSLTWWEAAEVARSFGKRLPTYDEFAALAYGTTENSSIGSKPGSTSWAPAYVSKWGVNQASGVMLCWGAEFSFRPDGGATPWNWRNNTNNRGQLYLHSDVGLVASIFGGNWADAASSGSRASDWANYPWNSRGDIGARLVCDHLSLD